jgi:hypothetical protein
MRSLCGNWDVFYHDNSLWGFNFVASRITAEVAGGRGRRMFDCSSEVSF